MKNKKILSCVLVLCLFTSLVGCTNKTNNTASIQETKEIITDNNTLETTQPHTSLVEDTSESITETNSEDETDMGMTWQTLFSEMGMGWNLGNTFDSIDCNNLNDELDYETAWVPNKERTTKEMILKVKEAGFNTIRIPVSWHNHVTKSVDDSGNISFEISDPWVARVKEVVDYCYDEGLYVIINIHHDDEKYGYIYPTEDRKEESIAYITSIWTRLANEFADYDCHLIFEVMNEARLFGTADEWVANSANAKIAMDFINEYNQAGVNAIRAVNKGYNEERFIGCPGYAASIDCRDKYVLPIDPGSYPGRIMVSVHAYTPYHFTMDTSETSISKYSTQIEKDIDYLFSAIQNKWLAKDVPAYIGEWGAILKEDNNVEDRIMQAKYYTDKARACKDMVFKPVSVPCILWDNGQHYPPGTSENFGFLDRTNLQWFDVEYIKTIIGK